MATVIELAPEAMFSNHFYGFGGLKFRQMEGEPIGLRGTCTIARLIMQIFDKKWTNLVEKEGIELTLYMRYMDDGRKLLQPIRKGWRWEEGSLMYSRRWEEEDCDRSPLQMTVSILQGSMKGLFGFLEFTFETGEDFDDGWLPTLDMSLTVNQTNQVDYRYYEKPTTTNTTIRKNSAMSENPKVQCLANDMVRRLLNTREELSSDHRAKVVDRYGD